jgi:hypothetical protein
MPTFFRFKFTRRGSPLGRGFLGHQGGERLPITNEKILPHHPLKRESCPDNSANRLDHRPVLGVDDIEGTAILCDVKSAEGIRQSNHKDGQHWIQLNRNSSAR